MIVFNKVLSNTDEDVREILSNKTVFTLAKRLK